MLSNGIVVYSIMLMSQARDHPLIKLSTQTGGKSCIFSDSQHTTYYDCLNGILHHRSPLTAPNQVTLYIVTAVKLSLIGKWHKLSSIGVGLPRIEEKTMKNIRMDFVIWLYFFWGHLQNVFKWIYMCVLLNLYKIV